MGRKERQVMPVPAASLEDLVPQDHIYRYLDLVLDLTLVPELVRATYCVVPHRQYTKRRRRIRWGLGGRPQTQGWAWRLRCWVATWVT